MAGQSGVHTASTNVHPETGAPPSATAFKLFLLFSYIGLSSFGGGVPVWMRRTLVERRGWLDEQEFSAALALARRAYLVWHASFTHLFRRHARPQSHPRPATFDLLAERGQGIAGSPATVAQFLASQVAETGCNYVVGQFAFGDLTREESLQSIGLFAREVMPLLRAKAAAGAMETAGVAAHGRR